MMAKGNPRRNSGKSGSRFKSTFSRAQRAKQSRSHGANSQQQQPRTPRPLRGTSIIDFAERQIDYSKSLLGNRWLSIELGGFVVAPSGHGKSTMVIQTGACLGCGKSAFGIHPARPLRVLIIQSEDDDNDVIEMAMLVERLGFSQAERDLVRKNTHVEWLNDVAGPGFFPIIDDFLTAFPADLLIINPYSAYLGGSIYDEALNNEFLRIWLSALLAKHHCAALVIHHTPKTQFQNLEEFSWYDWMYNMAGGPSMTNWARAVMIMVPSPLPGTYRFIAAKRFEKIGWQEREQWFSHSIENGRFLWVPSTADQIASATKGKNAGPDDLLPLIPLIDPITVDEIWAEAHSRKWKIGINKVRSFLKVLVAQQKAFVHSFPRPRTNPEVKYARTPQV